MVDRRSINISREDLEALSRLGYAEARTINDERGIPSVVDVVTNRAAIGGWWGSTPQSVINSPMQFSPINAVKSWEGLPAAPAAVQAQVASHLASQAFGAPQAAPADAITGLPSTSFLNPSVQHTQHAKNTWAKDFESWGQVGQAPNAHSFGNPDNRAVPDYGITLDPSIQSMLGSMYGPGIGAQQTPGFGLAQPMDQANKVSTVSTPAIDTMSMMPGSVASLGPSPLGFNPGYSTPPSVQSLSTVNTNQAAPNASPPDMSNPMSVGQAISSQMNSMHPTLGLQAQALGFGLTPEAMASLSQPSSPATVNSVTTTKEAGLSPSQMAGMTPAGRIDQAFSAAPALNGITTGNMYGALGLQNAAQATVAARDQEASPSQQASGMTPDAVRGRIDTAHSLAPGPNQFGGYGTLTGLSPSPPSPAASVNALGPANPSSATAFGGLGLNNVGMTSPSPSTSAAMAGPTPGAPGMTPARSTVAAPQDVQPGFSQAPASLGLPGIDTTTASLTSLGFGALSPAANFGPATAFGMAAPAAPAMAAPQATVAPPAQTQQQQQQKASSQPAAPSVAAPQSLTANLDSALGVAAAMSQQAKNAMAGMNPNANTKADTTPGGQKGGNTGKSSGGGSSSGAGASKGGGSSTDSGKSSGKGGVGSVGNKGDGRGFGGKSKGDDGSAW